MSVKNGVIRLTYKRAPLGMKLGIGDLISSVLHKKLSSP